MKSMGLACDFAIPFEQPLGCDGQNFGLVFPPWHPDGGKMAYQARRDKHRTNDRECRVVNATCLSDQIAVVRSGVIYTSYYRYGRLPVKNLRQYKRHC